MFELIADEGDIILARVGDYAQVHCVCTDKALTIFRDGVFNECE